VLREFESRNIEGILDWSLEHKDQIQELNDRFLFNLFKLQFIQILNQEGKLAAIMFVRNNIDIFGRSNIKLIQDLIAKMLTIQLKNVKISDSELWEQIGQDLTLLLFKVYKISSQSPLDVVMKEGL
jgi:hypothetical protein